MSRRAENIRVLVVDDMKTVRDFIVNGLQKVFFNTEFDQAEDGSAAQLKIEKNPRYDMIISDLEMPKMKGTDLLKWIRSHPVLKDIPFIMLTADSARESVMEAMKLGVNAYVVKPFSIEGLSLKMTTVTDKFDRREADRFITDSPVTMRVKNERQVSGNLIDISYGGMFAIFPRNSTLPNIMDDVVVEIFYAPKEGPPTTVSISGFVIRLQASEVFRETEHIKIAVKFDESCVTGNDEVEKFFKHLK